MKRLNVMCLMMVLLCTCCAMADTWTTLDAPWASLAQPGYGTHVSDISGNTMVGYYEDASGNSHGFYYNGTTWTRFNKSNSIWTRVYGISENTIVGSFLSSMPPPSNTEFGFRWDGSNMNGFGAGGTTRISGIDGSNLVGSVTGPSNTASFLYNDATGWTFLDMSGATSIYAQDIDGSNIVGYYTDSSNNDHGFLYNGTDWTPLDMPGASKTYAYGISGNKISGQYIDASGTLRSFLYDGTTWTTINKPDGGAEYVMGIEGSNLVGWYSDVTGGAHGFAYEIPEPCTLLLLGLGSAALLKRNRKNS